MSSNWQPRRRRARLVTAATVVVVVAGAGTAWGLTRGSGASYRTSTAANGTVQQTLAATGTVSPVSHADESFEVSGTVAHVLVRTGQRVHAGQVLAYLNRSELRGELRTARSELASARNRMTGDETGESTGASSLSGGSSTPTFESSQPDVVLTSPPSGGGSGGSPSGGLPTGGSSTGSGSLAGEQAAVRNAQQATDEALAASSQDLQAANEACSAATSGAPTSGTSSSDPASPKPTATPSADPTTGTGTSNGACTTAGAALLAAQQTVDRDEQQVASAESALTKLLSSMSASVSKSSHPTSGSGTSPSTDHEATTASAADIALDQASIDQALSTVDTDLASLDQATLRSTIAGRVAAATVAHGDQVTASSSDPAFIIVGSKQEQTTIDLSATEIREVKVGMTAHLVADGSSKVLTGRVVGVDAAGVESSTGSVTFPVTITLPNGSDIVSGAAASVTLVVAAVDDVLAVPTSAVHYVGTTAYVELLRGGKETRRTVKIGAIGAALTQITSGLTAGDRVILADLNASVPSSSSTLTGGGGFFGGGGAGGAEFTRRFAGGGGAGFGAVTVPVSPAG